MATDGNLGRAAGIIRGSPFSVRATSADASGNGVEVVPAATGLTPYVLGYQVTNASAAGLTFYLCHTAAAAGKTAIGLTEYLATVATMADRHFPVPIAGSSGLNVGFVASASGNVEFLVWGYWC